MAGEGPGHVHPGQNLLPREPGPLPEGDHAVRVHRIPAVEEDDLVTFHDRAHAEEGRQVEHEVGAAVDQGDLARVEGPEDPVQGGHGGREGGPRDRPELRDRYQNAIVLLLAVLVFASIPLIVNLAGIWFLWAPLLAALAVLPSAFLRET